MVGAACVFKISIGHGRFHPFEKYGEWIVVFQLNKIEHVELGM
jgi:hypothetical protein